MGKIVYQGGASIDENGRAYGGKDGNQTGRELRIAAWYLHDQDWYVLRAKDPIMRKRIAEGMRRAQANMNIGYNQHRRNTLWESVKQFGFDPAKATKPVATDCSALIRLCVAYAGKVIEDSFTTTNERKVLMATGRFTLFTSDMYCKRSDYLMEGDILVTRTKGHTVAILNDGEKAGVQAVVGNPHTEPTEKQVKAIIQSGSAKMPVKWVQYSLNDLGYPLVIDGDYGPNTEGAVKRFQLNNTLEVDGKYGPKTHEAVKASLTAKPKLVTIRKGSWNVRTGPTIDLQKIGSVKGGETYTYVSTAANGWVEIQFNGTTGWVSGKGVEA